MPLLLGHVVGETGAQVCFTFSSKLGPNRWKWRIVGCAFHVIGVIFWFWMLTLVPLGIALPLTGFCYIAITFVSSYFLNEDVGKYRWLGVFLIGIGMAIIASVGGIE